MSLQAQIAGGSQEIDRSISSDEFIDRSSHSETAISKLHHEDISVRRYMPSPDTSIHDVGVRYLETDGC